MSNPVRDVVVVGAGPAGMAAAGRAAESGAGVLLLDDNPRTGGQIWRADVTDSPYPLMLPWSFRITERHVEVWNQARVVAGPAPNRLIVELPSETREVRYSRLILATGARELLLPFPGWTLPGVCGAGGLQALVKGGLPIYEKRVVVAGTGPLLLAVAAYLRKHGAKVVLVAEQAGLGDLVRFGLRLIANPGKLAQAAGVRAGFAFTPYRAGCWPLAAEGEGRLERVRMNSRMVACDYLACGFGLIPNTELAGLLGCRMESGRVMVDELQKTSVDGVFAAGEVTGIGGLELSLVEGEIAGFSAGGRAEQGRLRFPARLKHRRFAEQLEAGFPLRDELKHLADAETVVCRCEDVTCGQLDGCEGWREAKLYTRCGMGPCQGRVCGAALAFLRGWDHDSVRPPVFPARIESLSTQKER